MRNLSSKFYHTNTRHFPASPSICSVLYLCFDIGWSYRGNPLCNSIGWHLLQLCISFPPPFVSAFPPHLLCVTLPILILMLFIFALHSAGCDCGVGAGYWMCWVWSSALWMDRWKGARRRLCCASPVPNLLPNGREQPLVQVMDQLIMGYLCEHALEKSYMKAWINSIRNVCTGAPNSRPLDRAVTEVT